MRSTRSAFQPVPLSFRRPSLFNVFRRALPVHLVASIAGPVIVVATTTVFLGRLSFGGYSLSPRPFLLTRTPQIIPINISLWNEKQKENKKLHEDWEQSSPSGEWSIRKQEWQRPPWPTVFVQQKTWPGDSDAGKKETIGRKLCPMLVNVGRSSEWKC